MDLRDYLTDTARAVAFLSRIRVPSRFFEDHDGGLSRAIRAFPFAGVIIALPAALVFGLMLAIGASGLVASISALGVQALITGALHEDGLSDAADGLGGGRDREHALAIMKDSRIGSYGAVALVLVIGLRAAALADLGTHLSAIGASACLIGVAALSRALMVWHWSALPPARVDGIAAGAGMPEKQALQMALLAGLLLAAIFLLPASSVFAVVVAVLASSLAAAAFTSLARRRLDGHTGDTIGATQQICEAVALTALAMAT